MSEAVYDEAITTLSYDYDYLLEGNVDQRHAHAALKQLSVFSLLSDYSPILVGTVPLDIHISSSDLDIICEVHHFEHFELLLHNHYGMLKGFRYSYKGVNGMPRAVCSFNYNGRSIEIFAQPIPTSEQSGFKHMMIEHRILKLRGERDKEQLRKLKLAGWKTEPAFAMAYKLEGDPYETLLDMYNWSDERLKAFFA